jgi:hypothetical protein
VRACASVRSARVSCALIVALLSLGCGAAPVRRFTRREPLWVDEDDHAFSPRPAAWYSPYIWDGVDNSAMRPLSELFALELDHEATNVNALDEVPASSWFTNRLSRSPLPPERVARGACEDESPSVPGVDDDVTGPFLITRGKPDGSTRGFFVRDREGREYLMKPDDLVQPERGTAADAIGAAVFWAAGYFVPCNRVVYIAPSALTLDPEAEVVHTDGQRAPLTRAFVDEVLGETAVDASGRHRFVLSRFIEGEPISPWRYEGTWDADPNDVVPHEERRDMRGMFVLSAWLSHIDSRQENTLATWIAAEGERGHVRHYLIDFSDSLGILHPPQSLARRFGHAGYIDFQYIFEDFATFGLLDRPWNRVGYGRAGRTLGYYDVDTFEPAEWRPGYPNPAYDRMTERDAAWMARIVARFGDAHIHALVGRGRFSSPVVARELERILRERRDRILARWLTRLSPLTSPRLEDDPDIEGAERLCLEDRAVTSGFRDAATRHYEVQAFGLDSARARPVAVEPRRDGVCIALLEEVGAPTSDYLLVDVVARTDDRETTGPLRVHVELAGSALHVLGLERFEHAQGPPS